jgi:GT2 family glycosyltransferase/spore maturation protein CgeB
VSEEDPAATLRELEASYARAVGRLRHLEQQVEDGRVMIEEARREATELREERDRLAQRLRKAERDFASRGRQLARVERQLTRLRARRSVRLALAAAAAASPLVRLAKRIRHPGRTKTSGSGREPASSRRRSFATTVRRIRRLRSAPHSTSGPLVSIVILTRNGAHHLERLLPKLAGATAYRSFEVIVIDNASTDGTAALLERSWGFPLRVHRNPVNTSFSAGCNQGIADATGAHVLLLNNDIEPINPGWLGAMVDTLEADARRGAVGALLVYPQVDEAPEGGRSRELTVQHRGIRFTWDSGVPRAMNQGGDDPTLPSLAEVEEVPAATAACLLVRGETLREVGGLDEAYVYGAEDVDLCLEIVAAGWTIVECGEAALFHHESSTQDSLAAGVVRINRMTNAQSLAEQWASRLDRSLRLDLFRTERRWLEHRDPTVAITLTQDDPAAGWGDWYTAHELGDALGDLGWKVLYAESYEDHWYSLPPEIDVVVSLLDRFDIGRIDPGIYSIAWIRNWVERWVEHPWIDDYDLVLASSDIALDIVRDRTSHRPARLPLATNPDRFEPRPLDPTFAADYTFTGNYWGVERKLMSQLEVRPDERFLLFGKGWDRFPRMSRYWRGHLRYEQLPDAYSSAKIVLDDTAGPTKPYGAVNARVFDALASGTLVLTDNGVGARELFDDLLPSFDSRQELRDLLDRYLGDDELRTRTAAELRQMVLDRYTYQRAAASIVTAARDQIMTPRVAVKIGPPDHETAERSGDTHFARVFAAALRRSRYATRIDILPEWHDRDRQAVDVAVHLRGLTPYVPKPSHVNVLWVISHPEDVTAGECEPFDLVLVASDLHATRLREAVNVPVHTMYQATDPHRFSPTEPDPDLHAELLFVGNSRLQDRHGVRWAVEARLPLTIYGSEWEGLVDPRLVRAAYFPNERLNDLYCSADIVLNDHWPDMRDAGLISNRIFDALACGAFVISDSVSGIGAMFDGAVPTYSSREELAELVRHYLAHPAERKQLAARGMKIVRDHHTFDARAAVFDDLVTPLLASRPSTVIPGEEREAADGR